MSALAHELDEPDPGPLGPEQQQTISVLEAALRKALETVPRAQVLKRVAAGISMNAVAEESARLLEGKVDKVSVSMPVELIETVRARTGKGGFSRYVSEAVRHQIKLDLLDDLLAELEAEHGPVPEQLLEQARREWPDHPDNAAE
jgi:Arc/MetJ-type ribon-helix-helix transcriptional regulator